ncbi:MAG: hypothetical protein ACI4UB_06240 [Limosilactobacillus sp.]
MSRHLTKNQIEELHQDILTTVRQSYPSNGYQIVAVSPSSSSESLYVYVMYKRRLYYLRFSAHNNEIKGHGYTTFNLLQYSNWSQLKSKLHSYFLLSNQTNAYKLMGYHNFIWLALIYRCSTNPSLKIELEPADDIRKVTIYMDKVSFAEVVNAKSIRKLLANLLTGLITPNAHIDRVYSKDPCWLDITPSGIKLLNHYADVSKYGTDHCWLTTPTSLNIKQLVHILNSI